MKLARIALAEFRKFRDPLVLDGLDAGLNLFVGPNEAGKSTVAAALRAAFLERHGTRTVSDLAPRGESGARPTVELSFSHGGHEYALKKHFLARPRCELLIDGGARRLEGEEAENALAALLGFELPARGQSKPELAGVPGLLWIQQGEGQDIQAAARRAETHLRQALTELTGELAGGDGDRLHDRVAAERGALLDARNGRPKGPYKEAEEALAAALAERDECARAQAQLDADVDRLAALREAHARAQAEEPWKGFEARAAEARARLAALARERESLEVLRREQSQAARHLALLQEQVARDQQDEAALRAAQAELDQAARRAESSRQALAAAQQARDARAAAAETARRRERQARSQAERRELEAQRQPLEREAVRLEAAVREAMALIEQGARLKAEQARIGIAEADMQALRARERELADLALRQQTAATRLRYALEPGRQARLDGAPLDGSGDVLLTGAAELELPGFGRLRIEPGGEDLPALGRDLEAARAARDGLLARLGAADAAEAEARHARCAALAREQEGVRKMLAIHAPQGVDALREQRDEALARRGQLLERLARLPPAEHGAGEGGQQDLAEAREALRAAEAALEQASHAFVAAQRAADADAARAQVLRVQAGARQAEFESSVRAQLRRERGGQLAEARSRHDALARRVQEAQAALAGHRPDLAEQDAARYEKSAAIEREAQHRRHEEILQLQGKLEQAGAQGLGERLSEAEAACERLARRRDELARRARALDLLHELLGQQRREATQRLQAPLARRLGHYLDLLMPQARLRLDDALLPAALARGQGEDPLEALSFGTREQLGLLARFAYADLLREAGRPTLLVLDDALVHTDDARRDFMKRALFDAATRHQILMFTCHGEAWRDLGVPQRALGA